MYYLKKGFILSIILLSSFLVGLLLCEMLVRVVAPQRLAFGIGIYEPHSDLVFKLRPHLDFVHDQPEFSVPVQTNSLGFRDKEISPVKKGSYRILGVGDSFSFANGVSLEETFFKQLEQCLNSGGGDHTDFGDRLSEGFGEEPGGGSGEFEGRQVEIINGGVPAYSLIQEKRFVKKYSEKLDIDAVLVGFYVGNDFIDSLELFDEQGMPLIEVRDHNLFSLKDRDQEDSFIRGVTAPARLYLAKHSHLYTFMRNRFSELLVQLKLRAPIPPPEFMEKNYSPHMEKAWEATKELFLELFEYTSEKEIDLYTVALPTIYQAHHEKWDRYVEIHGIDSTLYDPEKPQDLLSEFFAKHGMEYIDVLPQIHEVGNSESLYYPIDSHMNAAGHRVVANTLCTHLAPQFQFVLNN